MRFIPAFSLREGLILGKSIYNNFGGLLLKEGSELKQAYIEKILELGFQGLYIEDDISKDIEIEDVISDGLKLKCISQLKNMFINIEHNNSTEKDLMEIDTIAKEMVYELIGNKDLMVNMIDIRSFDNYIFYHSVNVAILSIIMGIALNLNRDNLNKLAMGALLHDVGKVFIDQDLLNKQGQLTDEEFKIMKAHSINGYRYIKSNFNVPVTSYVGVLDHHEKYDGTGYPNNKVGKDISLFGRIIAIADVYDSLTSDRPYRKSALPANVIEYLLGESGSHFDFDLVNTFIEKVAAYPVGTCVKLNNGVIGIVVENYSDSPARPKIRVLNYPGNQEIFINLRDDINSKSFNIVDIVDM